MPSYWFSDVEIQVQRRRDVDPQDKPLPREYAGFIHYPSNHDGLFDWDNFADGVHIVGGLLTHIPLGEGELRYVGPLYDCHRFRVLPNAADSNEMVDRCVKAVIALDLALQYYPEYQAADHVKRETIGEQFAGNCRSRWSGRHHVVTPIYQVHQP